MDSALTATVITIAEVPPDTGSPSAFATLIPLPPLLVLAFVATVLLVIAWCMRRHNIVIDQPIFAMIERPNRQFSDHHFRILPEPTEEQFTVLTDDAEQVVPRCFICGKVLLDGEHDHDP